jgi:hypothetical protein
MILDAREVRVVRLEALTTLRFPTKEFGNDNVFAILKNEWIMNLIR